MKTIKLFIPNMKSTHCQMTVGELIKEAGAHLRTIVPMSATIQLSSDGDGEAIVAAIRAGGYKVEGIEEVQEVTKSLRFNTNVKCSGCVAKVAPYLDEAVGKDNWSLDYDNVQKVLTVVGENDSSEVVQAIERAGYYAEEM